MAGKKVLAGKVAKKSWKVEEEEILINEWSKYECLYKTNSSEFKRVDKKQAAREAIRRILAEETGSSFNGNVIII
jgi:hypothetical protein